MSSSDVYTTIKLVEANYNYPGLEENVDLSNVNFQSKNQYYNTSSFYCEFRPDGKTKHLSTTITDNIGHELVGRFNEIEYSANFHVSNPILRIENYTEYVAQKHRRTFRRKRTVYYNCNKLSTARTSDRDQEIVGDFVLRLDAIKLSPTQRKHDVSCKWKLYKHNIFIHGLKINQTKAVETNVPTVLKYKDFNINACGNKTVMSTYWFLEFTYKERKYHFRVDFRKNATVETYTVNVECEDFISYQLFYVIFNLIFKYYKHQYVTQDRVIFPYNDKRVSEEELELSNVQQEIYSSMKLLSTQRDEMIDSTCIVAEPDIQYSENLIQFIQHQCLYSFLSYVNDTVMSKVKLDRVKFLHDIPKNKTSIMMASINDDVDIDDF